MSKDQKMGEAATTKDKTAILMDLINKHGMGGVPDEELAAIGYKRTAEGRITSIDYLAEREEKEKELARERLENRPFDVLEVDFENKDILFKPVSSHLTNKVFEGFEEMSRDFDGENEVRPYFIEKGSALETFSDEIRKFLEKKGMYPVEADELMWLLYYSENYNLYSDFSERLDIENKTNQAEELLEKRDDVDDQEEGYFRGGDFYGFTAQGANEVFDMLETARGLAQDVPEAERMFEQNFSMCADSDLALILENSIGDNGKPSEYFMEVIHQNSGKSAKECVLGIVKEYFAEKGWDSVASKVDSSLEISAINAEISAMKNSVLPDHAKMTGIKKKMNGASTEEKILLSGEMKDAEAIYKNSIKILDGFREFLNMPKRVSSIFARSIKEMQGCLFKSGKNDDSARFYLDGNFDAELDKNPGEKSGDCTNGKPLPFEVPAVRLSNVKVYDAFKKHIGNIYLLDTENEAGEKIWHLEAVQIPSVIDWEKSFPRLIEKLSVAAKAKGVKKITVNDNDRNISNYDYIRKAAVAFHENQAGNKTDTISYPKVNNEKYSNFQGDGDVRVVWEMEPGN